MSEFVVSFEGSAVTQREVQKLIGHYFLSVAQPKAKTKDMSSHSLSPEPDDVIRYQHPSYILKTLKTSWVIPMSDWIVHIFIGNIKISCANIN